MESQQVWVYLVLGRSQFIYKKALVAQFFSNAVTHRSGSDVERLIPRNGKVKGLS